VFVGETWGDEEAPDTWEDDDDNDDDDDEATDEENPSFALPPKALGC